MNEEKPINYIPEQQITEITYKKPKRPAKPKPIKKPTPEKPLAPAPPQQIEPTTQTQIAPTKKSFFSNKNEPKETLGYDTLNPKLYKITNTLLLLSLLIFICFGILTAINYIFFPTLWLNLIGEIIGTVFTLICFVVLFMITKTSLKKNDVIVIRKFRSGSGVISRINLKGKSELLFDKKDPISKVLISWAGAITDVISGCRMIQITEGHPTNDNLNSQVTESEWDKDVSRLTKAKSVADLAEAELFNQGLFGLKWQDLCLIIIVIMCLGIIGYLIMGAPDAIAKKTIEGLMNGQIQQALSQALLGMGVPTPAP